jgi:hypothetical protein
MTCYPADVVISGRDSLPDVVPVGGTKFVRRRLELVLHQRKAGDNELNGVFQKKDTAQLSLLWNNADGQWAITICCHTFCSFRPEEKEFYFKATY